MSFEPVSGASARPIDILVVEDDLDVRDAVCDVLSDEGYRVTQAVDGRDALEKLATPGFDPALIVLDMVMPVMNGREFLERRQANAKINAIPVLVLSATIDRTELGDSIPKMQKPVDCNALIGAIKRHMRPPGGPGHADGDTQKG